MVAGRQILYVTQGIGHNRSYWTSFGYMLCILACFKISIYILTLYPWERIMYQIRSEQCMYSVYVYCLVYIVYVNSICICICV